MKQHVDEGRRPSIRGESKMVTTCGVSAATLALPLAVVNMIVLSMTPGTSTKSSMYEPTRRKVMTRVAIAKLQLRTEAR